MFGSEKNHFLLDFPLAFELLPLDDTLTLAALDVCPELALLPFLTTSSCLFYGVKKSAYSCMLPTHDSHTLTPFLAFFLGGATSSSSSSFSSLALPL